MKRAITRAGKCRLCGVTGPVCLSHLIPRKVFEILLKAEPKEKAPVLITDKITVMKHWQIKDYLLCDRCEERFNKNGERYALEMMNTHDGFPLMERLRVAPPLSFNAADRTAFAGEDIGLDMDKLAYFGLSVFWRAGAHKWPNKMTVSRIYSIDLKSWLGPIGSFLLGGRWPSGVSLMVTAATDHLSQGYTYYPALTTGLPSGILSYGFLTCGIHFTLFLKDPLPFPYALFCCTSAPRRPLFARDMDKQTTDSALFSMRSSRVAANLKG